MRTREFAFEIYSPLVSSTIIFEIIIFFLFLSKNQKNGCNVLLLALILTVTIIFFNSRKAWILPHCLSTTSKVETVEFDAAQYNGGIIQPDKIRPSDLGTVYIHYRPLIMSQKVRGVT